jgi:outer membrane protein OmpA-like peptidoglycan-associated protein
MVDHPEHPRPDSGSGDVSLDEEKAFQELRSVLLGLEQQQISALRERLQNPELRTQDVSAVLAEAIRLLRQQEGDHALSEALGPSVEGVLKESVRRDPSVLAEALFPVMGPAIRRSIAESIRSMLQSFNEALEHSLSIQGIKWRIEAIRTGRSFAEVVLLRSLVYRVEQVFLIHKKTGLLLQHVIAPAVEMQDPDMVSGMLSAIQDFVRDSFNAPQGETLNTLQVGELQVWVEQGPQAILAAVVRGNAPEALHLTMQERLEEAHRGFAQTMEQFEGDAAPFEALRDDLAQCLEARYRKEERARSRPYFLVLVILLLGVLATWKTFSMIQDRKWNGFVENLRQQPGIVITSFTKDGGRYHIQGLRDPLAVDPAALLAQSRLDAGRADFQLRPYYAMDEALILRRAQAILQPPTGVTLSVQNGILRVRGECPPGWAKSMRERVPLIAGLKGLDDTALDDAASLAHKKAAVESAILLFAPGEAEINPSQRVRFEETREAIRTLLAEAEAASAHVAIEVVGHADRTGPDATNSLLSERRASQIVRALVQAGIKPSFLRARGVGTSEPVRPEATERDRQFNRSVTFRVSLATTTGER